MPTATRMIGLDPGPTHTGVVIVETDRWPPTVVASGRLPHAQILTWLARSDLDRCVIEEITSYGMPVGRETFEAVWWAGYYACVWVSHHAPETLTRLPRRRVKLELCGQARARDATVRHAVADYYGGVRAARGTSRAPGPLRGVTRDAWQALALVLTVLQQEEEICR